MIQYDKDGSTLFYIDASGNRVSASPLDGASYSALLTVMDAQVAAVSANTAAVADYTTKLANAQINVNAGRPDNAPQKPLKQVVSDTGNTTYVPFVPALPDLIPPSPAVGSTTGGVIVQSGTDTAALTLSLVQAIYRKLFPAT